MWAWGLGFWYALIASALSVPSEPRLMGGKAGGCMVGWEEATRCGHVCLHAERRQRPFDFERQAGP